MNTISNITMKMAKLWKFRYAKIIKRISDDIEIEYRENRINILTHRLNRVYAMTCPYNTNTIIEPTEKELRQKFWNEVGKGRNSGEVLLEMWRQAFVSK